LYFYMDNKVEGYRFAIERSHTVVGHKCGRFGLKASRVTQRACLMAAIIPRPLAAKASATRLDSAPRAGWTALRYLCVGVVRGEADVGSQSTSTLELNFIRPDRSGIKTADHS
jgi:hypothetical protein